MAKSKFPTQKVPPAVDTVAPQRGKPFARTSSAGGSKPAATARHRANIQERMGSQLRIVVSPKRAFNEPASTYADGRTIAPVPFHVDDLGFSTRHHHEGLGV